MKPTADLSTRLKDLLDASAAATDADAKARVAETAFGIVEEFGESQLMPILREGDRFDQAMVDVVISLASTYVVPGSGRHAYAATGTDDAATSPLTVTAVATSTPATPGPITGSAARHLSAVTNTSAAPVLATTHEGPRLADGGVERPAPEFYAASLDRRMSAEEAQKPAGRRSWVIRTKVPSATAFESAVAQLDDPLFGELGSRFKKSTPLAAEPEPEPVATAEPVEDLPLPAFYYEESQRLRLEAERAEAARKLAEEASRRAALEAAELVRIKKAEELAAAREAAEQAALDAAREAADRASERAEALRRRATARHAAVLAEAQIQLPDSPAAPATEPVAPVLVAEPSTGTIPGLDAVPVFELAPVEAPDFEVVPFEAPLGWYSEDNAPIPAPLSPAPTAPPVGVPDIEVLVASIGDAAGPGTADSPAREAKGLRRLLRR